MPPASRTAEVLETHRRTPHLVRVVFGGEDLDGFGAGEFTDHYVKLRFPTAVRTYSVADWDADARRLTVDFVVHGDVGVAGPWALAAKPGDTLELQGPGGAYAPSPDAAWHLMAGDLSCIPAITASLARVPEGVPVHVLIELEDPADRVDLETPGDLHLQWLDGPTETRLVDAIRALDFSFGPVHAFVHGEASAVRAVRTHLLAERGVPRELVSATGYWKRTRTEEGWREDKAAWLAQAEAEVAAAR